MSKSTKEDWENIQQETHDLNVKLKLGLRPYPEPSEEIWEDE